MQSIILVRHCETTGQAADAPLTARGYRQAEILTDFLGEQSIERIVSSPHRRAQESIMPLAKRLGLALETEPRLVERVLSGEPREDWKEQLAMSFADVDRVLPGGESSRVAMQRGVAVIQGLLAQPQGTVVVVTHGNLLALILKHFNPEVGFDDWQAFSSPDAYLLQADHGQHSIRRLALPDASV